MSFLSAAFLFGTLAIAAPLYIHMIRRAPSKKFTFSTLRFLRPTVETVSSRSSLQHLFLMSLRMLAIILLCMAFARPYVMSKIETDTNNNVAVLFLIDNSASMNQSGFKNKVITKFTERASLLKPQDFAAVYTYNEHLRLVKDFNEEILKPQEFSKVRESLNPEWNSANLAQALIEAYEKLLRIMDEKNLKKADIELITDLQDDGKLEKLKQFPWPENVRLIIHPIKADKTNVSLHFSGLSKDKTKATFKIQNHSHETVSNLKLTLSANNKEFYTATYTLPGNQQRTVEIHSKDLPQNTDGYTAQITGDEVLYDNKCYFVTPPLQPKKIVYLGDAEKTGNNLYYLKQMFPDGNQLANISLRTGDDIPSLIIIERKLGTTALSLIRSYINKGATALWLLNRENQLEELKQLTSHELSISKESVEDYLMLSSVNYDHWLFKPFSEALYKDFSSIYFWDYRQLDFEENATLNTIAKFDNGSPAVLSKAFGKGEIIIMASSWKKADSQLAVNSKFIPFMLSLLNASNRNNITGFNFDFSNLPNFENKTTGPESTVLKVSLPGIYSLPQKGRPVKLAVNIPLKEASAKKLSPQIITEAGAKVVTDLDEHMKKRHINENVLKTTEEAKKSNLWQYMLLAALLMLALESIVGHFTHKRMALK